MSTKAIDPIVVQVIRNGLDSVAEQMAVTIRRTAYSTVIREVLDYATALFDREGRLIAQASRIPAFVNAMGPTLRFVLSHGMPLLEWHEGDVFLVNDPYLGGSQHLPDLATFMPVFHGGGLIGIVGAIAHHADVGGSSPGGYNLKATDIFQEGLRIPPVRLYQGGKVNQDVKNLITANMRLAELTWGDIEAQVAAMQIGEKGLIELLDRFTPETVQSCVTELLDYSERMVRQGIKKIPAGSYEFTDFLDDDGLTNDPIRIHVKITVEGDSLTADFTGTDPQRRTPINGSHSMITAVVHYAVMAAVAPDAPVNEGCFRPIRIVTPPGTIVNALPPAPVVGRIAVCHRCCDAMLGALSKAMPSGIPAAYYGMSNIYVLSGTRPDGATPWILFEVLVGGWGGRPGLDGVEACSAHIHNVANTPIEMVERLFPVRVERYELRTDSGGAGEFRGGCGFIRELRVLCDEAKLTIHSDRMRIAPYGLQGGKEGAKAEWLLNPGAAGEQRLNSKESGLPVGAGNVLRVSTQGGGGYGDPQQRSREAVARDVVSGKVSRKAAREVYGH